MLDFSDHIKQLRLERKLTQKQMADLIGINVRSYQFWESAKYRPKLDSMLAVIETFGEVSLMKLQKKNSPLTR